MGNVFYKIQGACLADFSPKGCSPLGIKIVCPKRMAKLGGSPPAFAENPPLWPQKNFPHKSLKVFCMKYGLKMVAHCYAIFLCSLDANLVGQLTIKMDQIVLKNCVFFGSRTTCFLYSGKISQLVFERPPQACIFPVDSHLLLFYFINITAG